jgi:hypothetical protein
MAPWRIPACSAGQSSEYALLSRRHCVAAPVPCALAVYAGPCQARRHRRSPRCARVPLGPRPALAGPSHGRAPGLRRYLTEQIGRHVPPRVGLTAGPRIPGGVRGRRRRTAAGAGGGRRHPSGATAGPSPGPTPGLWTAEASGGMLAALALDRLHCTSWGVGGDVGVVRWEVGCPGCAGRRSDASPTNPIPRTVSPMAPRAADVGA